MTVDIEKLKAGLENLKGLDFEDVEKEEHLAGNYAAEISMTKSFQIRLAARALGVNVHDLKSLPLKEYTQVTLAVMNFLFSPSDEKETPATNSEKSQ